ncbi:MAG: hypothetical protein FJ125_03940 [Deltaproteobacteria bacterium]|nr:hypothetical protein [Deltaproteobacteria bacterium]
MSRHGNGASANASHLAGRLLLCLATASQACCTPAEPPPYLEVVTLHGTPYARGWQHGQYFSSKIRSLYTMLLANSLLPYLNRERPDIASALPEYRNDELYGGGRFSYEVMLQSAQRMAEEIPEPYLEEMRGIADGAALPFEHVLVMNTFLDTMFALRSVTFFIQGRQSPHLEQLSFSGGLDADGQDNDSDGTTDEEGEGTVSPYHPLPGAALVEVPTAATVRIRIGDSAGLPQLGLSAAEQPGAEGVDPDSLRIQVNDEVVEAGDPRLRTETVVVDGRELLEATFTPAGGFTPASVVSLLVQANDRSVVADPPPAHPRFMRNERVSFSTAGLGKKAWEVANVGWPDGRSQPPSLAFAVRGSATPDGAPRLGQHFALLDSNTSHKHAAVFVHHPAEGPGFVVLGWAGLVWGFSGMSAAGLSYALNTSDTLNNRMVQQLLDNLLTLDRARLVLEGPPAGILGRELLARAADVEQGEALLAGSVRGLGWNVLLVDRRGGMKVVELDGDMEGWTPDTDGVHAYGSDPQLPGNLDAHGRPLASIGPDDLRMASHYQKNLADLDLNLGLVHLRPQRYWTSFYFRSLSTFYRLGEEIAERYGMLDTAAVIGCLREPRLVDRRDSMAASVHEPSSLRLHVAGGVVPVTDGEFFTLDLAQLFAGEGR